MTDADTSSGRHQWFLAQVKPNSYQIAARNLHRQGFRTFLPVHEETIRTRTRFVPRLRPLFPGYLFVALDLAQGQWRAINSTYGLTGLVRFGAQPSPVPEALVPQLLSRCDADGRLLAPDFAAGDQVVLTRGPLASFVATIENIAPDARVQVLLTFMGQEQRLGVRADFLRPAR
jgi:transcriptional antiterminator RfaH